MKTTQADNRKTNEYSDFFLDNRQRADHHRASDSAKRIFEQRCSDNKQTLTSIQQALKSETLLGILFSDYTRAVTAIADVPALLNHWSRRLVLCGDTVVIKNCPDGHRTTREFRCCKTPPCSHTHARESAKWQGRTVLLMERLPSGERWGRVKSSLARIEVSVPDSDDHPDHFRKMGWKFVSIGLRGTGDFIHDIQVTLGPLKRNLRRWLKRHGAVAFVIALDVGTGHGSQPHPHLHALIYGPHIEREPLQRWLRAQDCTVAGCNHPADDRCDECRAVACECHHTDGGRQRCNGSWDVDIRQAKTPHEALGYAVGWNTSTITGTSNSDALLATFLTTYKRPRVSAYGLAQRHFWRDRLRARFSLDYCKDCGQELRQTAYGERGADGHVWKDCKEGVGPI